ncbi:hypothetical protein GGS23DRAFT_591738 [Durotheca rogersii]|uniref:uncharacterized protein n=1 Tax=Durotheca rogersii TaxID=419775 RepID=UPI002221201B|nr:uncharacterized protein GGS23DRAFT_591738 [Durotheca rogersii]KAI5867928.1 hypothetical protein GGS23DRAFT_591738 [Durotheca rogersii]
MDPATRAIHPNPRRPGLLPLAPAPVGSSSRASVGAGSRGRRQVTAACEACRKRKSKCNAERPRCSLCVRHGTDCQYATAPAETHSQALKRKHSELQDRITPYEELFDFLKTKSDTESVEILRRIRSGADVGSVLRHAKDGDLLIQLSLAPESRRRYEFPYKAEMPASILLPDNLYLRSFVFETTFNDLPSLGSSHLSQQLQGSSDDRYLKPFHAAQIIDPNFSNVVVSKWTTVTSNDHLLRRLLTAYTYYQHPWTAAFHLKYFLDDMAAGRERFCSSLLVNAVLAAACHMCRDIPDRTKFWLPHTLAYQFSAEARRLWDIESRKSTSNLTTIQAAIVLSIVATTTAMDKVGTSYLSQAIAMAYNLNIFSATAGTDDEAVRKARAFTAWGLFCWQAWQGFYFGIPPLISHPPQYPLPDPRVDPQWYGEIWVRYPLSQTLFPINLSHVIRTNFDLRKLMNDIAGEVFVVGKPPNATAQKVLDLKSRLDAWFADLPETLAPTRVVLPDHLKIHLEYYGILISIMRFPVKLTPNLEVTWHNIIRYAEVRLETLLRLYYLRHSFECYDPLLMQYLMLLGDTTLEKLHNATEPEDLEALRSTLVLCAKGLYDQGHNYHIAVLVFRLMRDRMKENDFDLLRTHLFASSPPPTTASEIGTSEDDPPLMVKYVRAQWQVPIHTPDTGPTKRSLEYLVREYGMLSLDSEIAGQGGSSAEPGRPRP